jgi:PAS domain S-box-containing protein
MQQEELNRYWKTVVDTIQDGVMIVDKGGTIVAVNKALERITGFAHDELIGKLCSILNCDVCEMARESDGEHFCSLFSSGSVECRRCVLRRKDGSYTPILKNASLLHDGQGAVIGAVETMTDISEIVAKDTQIEAFRRELRAEDGFHGIIGAATPMQAVFDLIQNAAQSEAPVIIFGESGVGKDLVARAIHAIGPRRNKPYIKVNCAALNESLLESELFGHVKGAFTGAIRDREGRFESAQQGDIFLDEIGDLPLTTQVKLLRVLEEKVIERVGSNRPVHIDTRIISATNRNLPELIARGRFREDLFYRINVIPITVPPLRERVWDIPLLAEHFFRRIRLKSGIEIAGISNEAMETLIRYAWPGNVRELKSAFEYAFVSCRDEMIQPYHLPPAVLENTPPAATRPPLSAAGKTGPREQLVEALRQCDGNQTRAAKMLGVSRVTVWNRINKYGINLDQLR